jgi:hypothetical protein
MHHQVTRRRRPASATVRVRPVPHLGPAHPLADVAARACREPHRPLVGQVACGACWEQAVRADERVVAAFGLDPELAPDPFHVDEVAVQQACAGKPVRLTQVERQVAVGRLYSWGLSRLRVADRLGMRFEDVPPPPSRRRAGQRVGSGWVVGSRGGAA